MSLKFGVIGGDARQLYIADALKNDGHSVYISQLENAKNAEKFEQVSPCELGILCDIIIFPLPITKDGETLNTPLSSNTTQINDDFAKFFLGCKVFGGMTSKLPKTSAWSAVAPVDYYSREELVAGNAMLTAEAALMLALQESPMAINGSNCLVTGFGRIGKSLCNMLKNLNAKVDCAARKKLDFMMIENIGCTPLNYSNINKQYDLIFNTVPTTVLTEKTLQTQTENTVIIELASMPGGVDLDAAKKQKIRVVDGQSLPGKVSPKTAGEYIKQTIYNILEE